MILYLLLINRSKGKSFLAILKTWNVEYWNGILEYWNGILECPKLVNSTLILGFEAVSRKFDIPIFQYSNIPVFQYSNIQVFQYSSIPIFQYSNIAMPEMN